MKKATFSSTTQNRYLEDYVEGNVHVCGPMTVSEAEILEFAKRFDPQIFHTDPEAAKETVYGGLIASGWHTCSLAMRMLVDDYLPGPASLGSPGVDELRWLKPMRPGDELTLHVKVHKVKASKSKPDRGVLLSFCELKNQANETVATMMAVNLVLFRNAT